MHFIISNPFITNPFITDGLEMMKHCTYYYSCDPVYLQLCNCCNAFHYPTSLPHLCSDQTFEFLTYQQKAEILKSTKIQLADITIRACGWCMYTYVNPQQHLTNHSSTLMCSSNIYLAITLNLFIYQNILTSVLQISLIIKILSQLVSHVKCFFKYLCSYQLASQLYYRYYIHYEFIQVLCQQPQQPVQVKYL